ncbi:MULTISPECIES: PDZ domain-containing protein [Exiguobacterium]|uniref:PDZ domain-containing protein n=1 Tax=Exiguobacterium TaxID=33986 RepID=UPI001BE6DBF9|nr:MULTISPECIES: PDZ domain-containing protein [Exiguobacterium]MCT4783871.1 PDZ domain-containing protein [Exiguobacterium himgiriensis]
MSVLALLTLIGSPLLWVTLVALAYISMTRIKRERAMFRSRRRPPKSDWIHFVWPSLLLGVLASVATVWLETTVNIEWLVTFTVLYTLVVLTMHPRFVSPAFPLLVMLAVVSLRDVVSFGPAEETIARLAEVDWPVYALVFGVVTLAEAILLRWNGNVETSPTLILSKRGQFVGGHVVRRLWFFPLVVFLPPSFGFDSMVPVILPIPIGVSLLSTGALPRTLLGKLSTYRGLLAVIALGLFGASYALDVPYAGYVLLGLYVLYELALQLIKRENRATTPVFINGNRGAVIVDTLPGSPGEAMQLIPGESIYKVNGTVITGGSSFYEALQRHKPYIKLEVLNLNGDIRFVQRAMYETDPHELGILFVGEPMSPRLRLRKL